MQIILTPEEYQKLRWEHSKSYDEMRGKMLAKTQEFFRTAPRINSEVGAGYSFDAVHKFAADLMSTEAFPIL